MDQYIKCFLLACSLCVCTTLFWFSGMPNDFGTKILFNYQSGGLLHWKKTENVAQTMKTLFQNSTMDLEDENVGEEMNQTSYKYHLSNEFKQFKPNRSPIRLLCLILTRPATLSTKAQAVYDTWGSRCTFLYFLSTKSDLGDFGLPVLHNPAKETYANLWSKTKFGFKFAYKHHIDQIDWILKADDDTYVIMENLHAMLALYDPDIPTLFGAHYNKIVPGGTVSGGAGYLLSRKAVELVVTKAFTNKSLCREQDDGKEDAEMAWCLSKLGVHPSVSRDIKRDEETFIPLHIWSMMTLTKRSWMSTYMMKKPLTGFDCCSERAISFHYISHSRMYEMEYLIYKLKLFDLQDVSHNVEKRLNLALNSTSQHSQF